MEEAQKAMEHVKISTHTRTTTTTNATTEPTPVVSISALTEHKEGDVVSIYGFISALRAVGTNKVFIVLRQGATTVQAILAGQTAASAAPDTEAPKKEQKELRSRTVLTRRNIQDIKTVPQETYVRVEGRLSECARPVKSCTVSTKEIQVDQIEIVSLAEALPFQLKDVSWTEEERRTNTTLPTVALSKRLDHRYIDLRATETRSIFKVYSSTLHFFREYLSREFTEIRTPKIIEGASEGGADVFTIAYFKETASLSQSPQIYKQMAIIGGLEKVFEIGPCFRAENSNTGRHLTEFTGVDLEMELKDLSYIDLAKEIYQMLRYVILQVQEHRQEELRAIAAITGVDNQTVLTEDLVAIPFHEGIDLLRGAGRSCSYSEDIGTEDERELGRLVREKYQTDLFALVGYPISARPFYTSLCPEDANYTQSFDFIMKGEEISSGAERIHQKEVLVERIRAKGIDLATIQDYIDAFSFGVPRHGGCGIGLERVVKLLTATGDIHKCSMFPRDPSRLRP
ncbi:aspartyl-tRNA synthetase [Nematocida displodere]|uniref:Probable aspartate--tRNA ligase, cytoplasmic n=1 Tax=Nematocida displodere TaxID=1805483 RepID=A0A177EIV9_9MICR|nr:aspartyl-tRNA synthetase [Nematocida displodere]